jgi:hypothetical protein
MIETQRAPSMVFYARPGSSYSNAQAAIAGPELMRINQERGQLTAGDVVAEATPPESVLHDLLGGPEAWDDALAAHQHRLSLARNLIGSILVRTPNGEPGNVRAFYRADAGVRTASTYVPLGEVLAEPQLIQRVVGRFVDDIGRLQDDYSAFRSVAYFRDRAERVLRAVDETLEESD